MKVTFPTQLGAVCDRAAGRHHLDHVQISRSSTKGVVWSVATEGRIAAVVPCEGQTETTAYIPRSKASGQVEIDDPATDCKYPDVAHIVSSIPDLDGCLMIRLDHRLVSRLGQALTGAHGDLTLFINPEDGPIGVLGQHGIGAIMPMIVGPEEVSRYSAVRHKFIRDMKGKS